MTLNPKTWMGQMANFKRTWEPKEVLASPDVLLMVYDTAVELTGTDEEPPPTHNVEITVLGIKMIAADFLDPMEVKGMR